MFPVVARGVPQFTSCDVAYVTTDDRNPASRELQFSSPSSTSNLNPKNLTAASSIKLPVASLLKQYKDTHNALTRHFDLLYIQQGVDRLPVDVCYPPH